jgi:hypothetical protein
MEKRQCSNSSQRTPCVVPVNLAATTISADALIRNPDTARRQAYRFWAKDFTFLPQTLANHRMRGYDDGKLALRAQPWEKPLRQHAGAVHYEISG